MEARGTYGKLKKSGGLAAIREFTAWYNNAHREGSIAHCIGQDEIQGFCEHLERGDRAVMVAKQLSAGPDGAPAVGAQASV